VFAGIGHGKLIVCGEHFVLDGATALAVGLPSLRTEVTWQAGAADRVETETQLSDEARSDSLAMIAAARKALGNIGPGTATVASTIPVARGVGSSAAFSVALVRALAASAGRALTLTALVEACRQVEDVVHGRSSGIDPAAAAAEGGVLFRDGVVMGPVEVAAGGRLARARWVLIDVGPAPATAVAIGRANKARMRLGTDESSRLAMAADSAARAAADALRTDDIDQLAAAMNANAAALIHLDVLDDRMTTAMERAAAAGAIATKQTGAGLGGNVLALAPSAQIAQTVARHVAEVAHSARTVAITR